MQRVEVCCEDAAPGCREKIKVSELNGTGGREASAFMFASMTFSPFGGLHRSFLVSKREELR